MKIINREIRTSEAGIALSVVTVFLVGVGYAALQFVSGAGEAPPVEIRIEGPSHLAVGEGTLPGDKKEVLPQVLPTQGSDAQDVPHVSQRPVWEPRPLGELGNDFDLNNNDSLWPGTAELPAQYEKSKGSPR